MGYGVVAKINIKKERCKGCGLCVIYCQGKNIELSKEMNARGLHFAVFSDKDSKCNGCSRCYIICPDMAIEVYK